MNANLSGTNVVGSVTSGGSKQITWTWGSGGTNLSSTDLVRARVYAVEMVLVPDAGAMTFGTDTSANNKISGGTYDPASAYYLMKYPVTAEMYAAFLNSCVNRHDNDADPNYDFYNSQMTDGDNDDRLDITSGSIDTADAVFTANSGQADYAMTYVNWWNAYDWSKWTGLRMPTEEEFEYEASNVGARDFPWGDSVPSTTHNIRCNMIGVDPSNASDVKTYDEGGSGNQGLSFHKAAEMAGNVYEWEFTKYYSGAYNSDNSTESQAGYDSGSVRVVRGGRWNNDPSWVRAGSRYSYAPSSRDDGVGFRAARTP